jgi:conjugative transfer region lipoprotein (TIGR03751 family)
MSRRIWINGLGIAFIAALAGCTTSSQELLTHDGNSMFEVWNQQTSGSVRGNQLPQQLLEARMVLRRPLQGSEPPESNIPYTRNAQNEIYRQFRRLPNPDLVMYVFPHLAGSDPVPVPGYSTVFPLYQRVQYAMPGDRVEDY